MSQLDARQIGALAAINPLVAAANPLLMTIASLRTRSAPSSVDALRARLLEMVREFDVACERNAIPTDHVHFARYALCTALDEAIQRTPWSHHANWAGKSLMVHFFKDIHGGERFFQILDKLVEAPSKYGWLLQLYYVCLSLGFMGQFELRGAAGTHAVADLRERLYQIIRRGQPEAERTLSSRWRGLSIAARQFKGFAAMWAVLGSVSLLCIAVFAAYVLLLARGREDLALGRLELKPAPPSRLVLAPPPQPRLPQLLAKEIEAKLVQVRENQLESVVTLLNEITFDSGNATPSRGASSLIERVAAELDKLEGRIVVTGHTDNVPSRTLQFPTNDELSRARARTVANIVMSRVRDTSRVAFEGRGDREPLVSNLTSEGRATNRRVEITLRVSGAAI
jgi:type VI secretion system protein ImpK